VIPEDRAAAESSCSSPTRNDRCSNAKKTQTLQPERTGSASGRIFLEKSGLGRFCDGHNGAIHKAGRRIGDNLIRFGQTLGDLKF